MPNNEEMSYVTTDNVKAGYIAANYLLELGHRKIAFVGGTGVSNSYRERLRGFKFAMEDKQVVPDIELIRNYDVNKRESGYKITKLMIMENSIPTAIIATNDLVALGVMEACDELGLDVPNDISVIGFDDIPYASLPKIKLTTVAQLKDDLGRIAVEIIFKSQKTDLSKNVFKEVLDPELIIRSTCKKI
jgi:LacI family transcriptional regulator